MATQKQDTIKLMNEEITPKQLLLEAIDYSEKEQSELHHPPMLVLHSLLYVYYHTTEQRIRALEDICAHHNVYLKDVEMDQGKKAGVFLECQSLIHYSKIIQDLLTNKSIQSIFDANKDSVSIPRLEQYIYLSKLPELDLYYHHYIAFTEGYGFYAKQPTKTPITSMAILQCKNFIGKLYSEDIMDFCRHLFCGEAIRRHEIGELKEHECFGIHDFDVAFRNHCFDVYIDIKKQEIAEEMNADNDRLYPPTVIDYLNQLLEESKSVVNREMQFEQFQGSYAYDIQYYAGRPDVLKMARYFVVYLQDKINQFKTSQSAQHITFNGPTTYTEIHDNKNILIQCDVGKIEMSANNVVIPQPGSTTNVGCDQRESKFTNNLSQEAVKQLQADNENKQLK